ncbi:hypothetical protein [Brunnivagina elsteri]|uniref:hypothetical protein n=1 Tax=Brunnivagina elsteri TaxID=1247191 RepID=UPI0040398DE8
MTPPIGLNRHYWKLNLDPAQQDRTNDPTDWVKSALLETHSSCCSDKPSSAPPIALNRHNSTKAIAPEKITLAIAFYCPVFFCYLCNQKYKKISISFDKSRVFIFILSIE